MRHTTARRVIPLLVLAIVALATPAQGAYAGTLELARAKLSVSSSSGSTYRVEIAAYRDRPFVGQETVSLVLTVSTCTGNVCSGTSLFKPLEPSEFVVESSARSATVTTSFAGRPLRVRWDGCDECASGSTYIGTSGVSHHEGGVAGATATLFGVRCPAEGLIERVTRVDTGGSSSPPGRDNEPRRPPRPFGRNADLSCAS